MSNLFVPIDYSNVSEVVPEGEDILYSTFCKVLQKVGSGTAKIKSHAIITQSGVGFSTMKKRKRTLLFFEWDQLQNVRTTTSGNVELKWGWSAYKRLRIRVLRDPEHESKETFLDRKKKFPIFCKEAWSTKVPKG